MRNVLVTTDLKQLVWTRKHPQSFVTAAHIPQDAPYSAHSAHCPSTVCCEPLHFCSAAISGTAALLMAV